jgi:hypothetical protein
MGEYRYDDVQLFIGGEPVAGFRKVDYGPAHDAAEPTSESAGKNLVPLSPYGIEIVMPISAEAFASIHALLSARRSAEQVRRQRRDVQKATGLRWRTFKRRLARIRRMSRVCARYAKGRHDIGWHP